MAESECLHGLLSSAEPKVYLSRNSVALEKLRSVVLDRMLLSNLSYYSKFRHIGMIENLNSMLMKYASRRNAMTIHISRHGWLWLLLATLYIQIDLWLLHQMATSVLKENTIKF